MNHQHLKKPILLIFSAALIACVFFSLGAYQYREMGWPFKVYGKASKQISSYEEFDAFEKELYQREAAKKADIQRSRDAKFNEIKIYPPISNVYDLISRNDNLRKYPFTSPKVVKDQLLYSTNSMEHLYDDLPFMLIPGSHYCPGENNKLFRESLAEYEKFCYRIHYPNFEFDTYAVRITGKLHPGQPKTLVIYNHGHDALPKQDQQFAIDFLKEELERGHDILFTSLPFFGVNGTPWGPMKVQTYDGPGILNLYKMDQPHDVFELFDVGKSHYMRFFIDGAILPLLREAKHYEKIHYVGLSGGGTVGLHSCLLLKDIVDHCILVAGVMPSNLRMSFKTFGDSESHSASFRKPHPVMEEVRELAASNVKLSLIYNDQDDCCYTKEYSVPFQKRVKEEKLPINFIIRKSSRHDFDPEMLRSILDQ